MLTKSRLSALLVIVLISVLLATTAWARGGKTRSAGGPGHNNPGGVERPGAHTPDRPDRVDLGDRPDRVAENRRELRRVNRRLCRNKARHGVRGGCYLHEGKWVEDVAESGGEAPPAAREDAAIVPVTRPVKSDTSGVKIIAPSSDKGMKNELIAARKHWLKKKKISEDAATARARAEYRASQDGSKVDPALIERHDQARNQELEAHRAMKPLVERARARGFSEETLELYERASRGY